MWSPAFGLFMVALKDAWALFEQIHLPTVARKTRIEYRAAWRHLAGLGEEPTAADVAQWFRAFAEKYSAGYANATLCVLRQVARYAADIEGDRRLLAAVQRVRPMPMPIKQGRCPPDDFYVRALELCRHPAERAWLKLACRCGLRFGELLGLQPDDWGPPVLRVVRQRLSPQRKNRRPHSCRIEPQNDADLIRDLEWAIEHRAAIIAPRGTRHEGLLRYIFPWGKDGAQSFLRRLRAGLGHDYLPPRVGWHACRHWGATQLARAGKGPFEVQAWLGDSSPDVAASYVADVRGATCAAPIGFARVGNPQPVEAGQGLPDESHNLTTTLADGVKFRWRS